MNHYFHCKSGRLFLFNTTLHFIASILKSYKCKLHHNNNTS
uniref:Uncharacterized protein n=1 Tax=Rhizophora mucronata TaxID=61149 RepID=A0A2P2N7C4_RHIMU